MSSTRFTARRAPRGVTLIELLVASALAMFVIGGAAAVVFAASRVQRNQQLLTDAGNESRDALGTVIRSLRIAGLEPENYTRAGAALRHASNRLVQQTAQHRLLLMLSDGKPNDMDHYEGRYGVEDLRQAVTEAKLQGISPFCLTIDRQAANYLPYVYGASQYALLPKPELLPTVLLDWLRRLVGH